MLVVFSFMLELQVALTLYFTSYSVPVCWIHLLSCTFVVKTLVMQHRFRVEDALEILIGIYDEEANWFLVPKALESSSEFDE
jgi:hypothetical protein